MRYTNLLFTYLLTYLLIKLLQKGVRVHHRRVILMQKMLNFFGRGHSPLPRPLPQWGGGHPLPTPHLPQHLDLNPSHSEILPTLLVHSTIVCCHTPVWLESSTVCWWQSGVILYIAVNKTNVVNKLSELEYCLSAVHMWLLHNSLCLNPTKSDAIVFRPSRQQDTHTNVDTISVSGSIITPSSTLKSLGVVLDRSLSFDQHVTAVCKNCYFHIWAIWQVRASLPEDVAKTVACSIIQSRLDYCNALFTGMSESNFKKLQRVQNTLATVVLRRGQYEHITSALAELHWLPIQQRITFKIATTIFKIRHLHQPTYLLHLLNHYTPTHSLRSSSQLLLQTTVFALIIRPL